MSGHDSSSESDDSRLVHYHRHRRSRSHNPHAHGRPQAHRRRRKRLHHDEEDEHQDPRPTLHASNTLPTRMVAAHPNTVSPMVAAHPDPSPSASRRRVLDKIWCPCTLCRGKTQQTPEKAFSHLGNNGRYHPPIGETLDAATSHPSMMPPSVRDYYYDHERLGNEAPVVEPMVEEADADMASDWMYDDTQSSEVDEESSLSEGSSSKDASSHDGDEHIFADLRGTHFGPTVVNEALPPYVGRIPEAARTRSTWDDLEDQARTDLYPGSELSMLSATMLVLNLQSTYKASNVHTDAMLTLLHDRFLPEGNVLPAKRSKAVKVLKSLGLDYVIIHACVNGCVLFRKALANADTCPICHGNRYRDDTIGKEVPRAVLRWFPIIPRILQMYRCHTLEELMTWHYRNRSTDGKMRYPHDSPAWQHIDEKYPDFAADPRNVRFGLAMDGVNPNKQKSSSHSTWPVLLINYNIPPWLAIKRGHVLLALLIPGPDACKNPDVYMAPLIEELQQLWRGIPARDATETFTLHAMLMWTIHDWPGLGSCSGLKVAGYDSCHKCGPDMHGRWSRDLGKMVFHEHRARLPQHDPMRRDCVHFGHVEQRGTPVGFTPQEWRQKWAEVEEGLSTPQEAGIHRWSILYSLEYWEVLLVRHLLDPMHIEVNVCKSLLRHIYGIAKNHQAVRNDCRAVGVHKDAWPKADGTLPSATWILPPSTRKKMNKVLRSLRFPTRYGAGFRKSGRAGDVVPPHGLKSHDYHKLLEHVLPILLKSSDLSNESRPLRLAIYELSAIFRWVCQKEIDITSIPAMKIRCTRLLCILEKVLPPSFFDLQVHLVCHLVDEVEMCGTVHGRWMYWAERYMKILKGYVRQFARLEGSISEGHMHHETLFYCTDALKRFDPNAPNAWEDATVEDDKTEGYKLVGKRIQLTMTEIVKDQVHFFVLTNDTRMQPLFGEYNRFQERSRNAAGRLPTPFPDFREWVIRRVSDIRQTIGPQAVGDDVLAILQGLYLVAGSYSRMWDSGRHFRTESRDIGARSTADCGVVTIPLDGAEGDETLPFCGIIQEILEVDFSRFKVVLLGAKWYRRIPRGRNATIERDECGFLRVDSSRTMHRHMRDSDVWVYPSQVDQCFYAPTSERSSWKIIVPVFPRGRHPPSRLQLHEDDERDE